VSWWACCWKRHRALDEGTARSGRTSRLVGTVGTNGRCRSSAVCWLCTKPYRPCRKPTPERPAARRSSMKVLRGSHAETHANSGSMCSVLHPIERKAWGPTGKNCGRLPCGTCERPHLLRPKRRKTPVESTTWGFLGTPWKGLEPDHMWSIMTWPNPEHDTWVAPSIKRAKS
jgi:hypothetical protein